MDAKKIRQSAEVEGLLRQFTNHDGPKGNGRAYQRGHEFNFDFTQAERDQVLKLMEYGMSFDEAFDYWKALPKSQKPDEDFGSEHLRRLAFETGR